MHDRPAKRNGSVCCAALGRTTEPFLGFQDDKREDRFNAFKKAREAFLSPLVVLDRIYHSESGKTASIPLETVLERERTPNPTFPLNDSDADIECPSLGVDVSQNLREGPERCACHGDTECSGSDMDICNSPCPVQAEVVVANESGRVPVPNLSAAHFETQDSVSPPFSNPVSPSRESVVSGISDDGIGEVRSEQLFSSKKSSGEKRQEWMRSLLKPCFVRLKRMPDVEKMLLQQKVVRAPRGEFHKSPAVDKEAVPTIDISDGLTLRKFCELESIVLTDSSTDEENDDVGSRSSMIFHRASPPRNLMGSSNLPNVGLPLPNSMGTQCGLDVFPEIVSENPVPSGVQALNELGFLEHESFQFRKDPSSVDNMWNDVLDFGEAMGIITDPRTDLSELLPVKSSNVVPLYGERVEKDDLMSDEEGDQRFGISQATPTDTVGESEFLTSLIRPVSPSKDSPRRARKGKNAKKIKCELPDSPLDVDNYGPVQNAFGGGKRKKSTSWRYSNSPEGTEKNEDRSLPGPKLNVKLPGLKRHSREKLLEDSLEAERASRELKYKLGTRWMMSRIVGMDEKRDEEELATREKLYSDLSTIPYIVKCHLQNRSRKCKDLHPCAKANKKFNLFFSLTVGAGRQLSRQLVENLKDAEDTCKINRIAAFIAASAVVPHPTTILVPAHPDVVQKLIPTHHASLLMELVAETEEMEKKEKKMISDMNLAVTLQFKRAVIAIKSRFPEENQDHLEPSQSVLESEPIILQSSQPWNPYMYGSNQTTAVKSKVDIKFKSAKKCLVPNHQQVEDENECIDLTEIRSVDDIPGEHVPHVSSSSPSKVVSSSDHVADVPRKMPVILSDRPTKLSFRSLLKPSEHQKTKLPSPKRSMESDGEDEIHGESEAPLRKKPTLVSPDSRILDKPPQILEMFAFKGVTNGKSCASSVNPTSSGCSSHVDGVSSMRSEGMTGSVKSEDTTSFVKSEDMNDSVKSENLTESRSPSSSSNDPDGSNFAGNDTQLKAAENRLIQKPNISQLENEDPDVILVPEKFESIDLTAGEDVLTDRNRLVPKWAAICNALPELGYVGVEKNSDKLLVYDKAVVSLPLELDGMEELGRFLNARLANLTFPHRKKIMLDWILVTSGYLILKEIPHTSPLFWLPPLTARKSLTDLRNSAKRNSLKRSKLQNEFGNETVAKKPLMSTTRSFRSLQRWFNHNGKPVRINGQPVVIGNPANCITRQGEMLLVRTIVMGAPGNEGKPMSDIPTAPINAQRVLVGTPVCGSELQTTMPNSSNITGHPVASGKQSIIFVTSSTTLSSPVTGVMANSSRSGTHQVYTKNKVGGYVPLLNADGSTVQAKLPASSTTAAPIPQKKKSIGSAASIKSLSYVPKQHSASARGLLMVPTSKRVVHLPAALSPTSIQPFTANSTVTPPPVALSSSAPQQATGSKSSLAPTRRRVLSQQVPSMNTTGCPPRTPQLPVSSAHRSSTPSSSSARSHSNVWKPTVRPGYIKYVNLASLVPGSVHVKKSQLVSKTRPAPASVSHVSGVVSTKLTPHPITRIATVPNTPKPPASTACASTASQKLVAPSQKLGPLDQKQCNSFKHQPILIIRKGTSETVSKLP